MTEAHKIRMARLAQISHELAELDGRRAELQAQAAKIYREMAEGTSVSLETGRRIPRKVRPELGVVSDLDRARAREALRDGDIRRRVSR